MEKKTSVFSNGLIWFGAAISIAEILTGTYVADMGVKNGLLTIFLGHLIGCVLLFLAGLIGAKTEKSAMETTKISFGKYGSYIFSILNVFQLIGWTAIMIFQGAGAANTILEIGTDLWSVIIGVLICVWIFIGIKNLGILNTIVMAALFVLTLILGIMIFKNPVDGESTGNMSFGAALELSVAMPLSWLPLISDYTREAENKNAATLVSVITYFFTSSFMFIIGFFAAMFTGAYEISEILKIVGMGVTGIIIVLASTVTTTFLDAYSAGVSSMSIYKKLDAKWVGIITCIIGILLSVFADGILSQLESFLYIIAAVFSPMMGVMIADFYILKNDYTNKSLPVSNIIIWAIGTVFYYLLSRSSNILAIGYTLPVVLLTIIAVVIVRKIKK